MVAGNVGRATRAGHATWVALPAQGTRPARWSRCRQRGSRCPRPCRGRPPLLVASPDAASLDELSGCGHDLHRASLVGEDVGELGRRGEAQGPLVQLGRAGVADARLHGSGEGSEATPEHVEEHLPPPLVAPLVASLDAASLDELFATPPPLSSPMISRARSRHRMCFRDVVAGRQTGHWAPCAMLLPPPSPHAQPLRSPRQEGR